MKPSFQHLGFEQVEGSFLCYEVKSPKFGFHWHYHPEVEISFVKNGYGTRLVGDQVEEFEVDDLLMLGSDLPHTLISDDSFNQVEQDMEVVVIQFDPAIFLSRSLEIEELINVGNLINASRRGLSFQVVTDELRALMTRIPSLQGFNRYVALLQVLNELSQTSYRYLASEYYSPTKSGDTEVRIGKVCSYIHDHFKDDIKIRTLAEITNMNEAAFCRFFKKMTGKTAVNYINDLRIGRACFLLQTKTHAVGEVAYQSGFNSIPHFNRYFQKVKGCTPTVFRKNYTADLS